MSNHINNLKEVISENPSKQVWKYLKFYLDVEYTSEVIRKIHKIPTGKHESNIKKQAQQIGYCIRQADEYFEASAQVGLATRPLLLYYGVTSLSQALALLKLDGTYSLDVIRQQQKHKHHGLELKGDIENIKPSTNVEDFLTTVSFEIYSNERVAWGQFPRFYTCLVPNAYVREFHSRDNGQVTYDKNFKLHADCTELIDIRNLLKQRFNLANIVKVLPDLYAFLPELEIKPNMCRVMTEQGLITNFYQDKILTRQDIKVHYILAGIPQLEQPKLVNYYKTFLDANPILQTISIVEQTDIMLHFVISWESNLQPNHYYLPDVEENIKGEKFIILEKTLYLSEPANYYAFLFCLGMIARYYPDIWIRTIDKNILIAELIDLILNIVHRKFPNLILDQMTNTKYFIHT